MSEDQDIQLFNENGKGLPDLEGSDANLSQHNSEEDISSVPNQQPLSNGVINGTDGNNPNKMKINIGRFHSKRLIYVKWSNF